MDLMLTFALTAACLVGYLLFWRSEVERARDKGYYEHMLREHWQFLHEKGLEQEFRNRYQ